MPLFAGIDGGQSTTTAVVGDESGRMLGRGTAGPADEVDQGPSSTRLRDALSASVALALQDAKLSGDSPFAAAVAGISGYDGRIYGQPPQINTNNLRLVHDTVIAHAGALGGNAGVVVICGTGCVAYAVDERGAGGIAGGWGYLFGDEGSAFWLAKQAIAQAMRAEDSGDPAGITAQILQAFAMPSLRKLVRAVYSREVKRAQIASFAPAVLHAAEHGDEEMAALVLEGARALVSIASQAMDRCGMQAGAVSFTGGMLRSETYRAQIAQSLRTMLPQARLVHPQADAAAGALLLARRLR